MCGYVTTVFETACQVLHDRHSFFMLDCCHPRPQHLLLRSNADHELFKLGQYSMAGSYKLELETHSIMIHICLKLCRDPCWSDSKLRNLQHP